MVMCSNIIKTVQLSCEVGVSDIDWFGVFNFILFWQMCMICITMTLDTIKYILLYSYNY